MKFIQAAAMATAAAISILTTTANPIHETSFNAATTDTIIANTIALKDFNVTAPRMDSTTTAMFNGGNAYSKHIKRMYDESPQGEPQGDYNNYGVEAYDNATANAVMVSYIIWAGDNGWTISKMLKYRECDIRDFHYEWTGYDYEATIGLTIKSSDKERRRQKHCIQMALRTALSYDNLVVG